MASLDPRRFSLKFVLAASTWICGALAFVITGVASIVSPYYDSVGEILLRALIAWLVAALIVGVPLGFVSFAVLEFRRHYLARRWRAQSGLTNRCS